QAAQTMGIDLPLKVLVWKDEAGAIWLSYTDPACLVERHGLDSESAPAVRQMTVALADIAQKAAVAACRQPFSNRSDSALLDRAMPKPPPRHCGASRPPWRDIAYVLENASSVPLLRPGGTQRPSPLRIAAAPSTFSANTRSAAIESP